MNKTFNRFAHTAAALRAYDELKIEGAHAFNLDEAHINLVREAFWLDTIDLASRDACMGQDIEFFRRMVKAGERSHKIGRKLGRRIACATEVNVIPKKA
jgi:hypothetical protein